MDGNGGRGAPSPTMNPAGQSHEALKGMTDPAEPSISAEIAAHWRSMGQALAQSGILLQQAVVGSQSGWTGLAADGMRYRLGQVVDWALKSSDNFAVASSAVEGQSTVVGEAKTRMPEPVPYDPAQMIKDAKAQGLWGLALLPSTMQAQYEKQKAAHEEAVRVVSTRDVALAMHAASIPSFLPPPNLSETGDPGDPGIPGPGPGPGGGGSGGGGTGGSVTGGGSGGGSGSESGGGASGGPTGPAPIVPAPIGPTQPNPGVTKPDQYVPGPPAPVPSLPPTGLGTGTGAPPGGPGFGPGVGFVPGTGFGPGGGGGGSGSGGGGGAGARGGGPGAGAPLRGPGGAAGLGAGGGPAAGLGGTRGATAARGGAGMAGMPLGAGRGEEDSEHKRPTYLEEPDPEALFGTDEVTAPPVIGDE